MELFCKTQTCCIDTKLILGRKCSKAIPPNTSWLSVLEDRLPAFEDTVDGWTASTTGSVRKGFEFGMDSSTASAAEVKGSEWEKKRRTKKKRKEAGTEKIMVERRVAKVKKKSACKMTCRG